MIHLSCKASDLLDWDLEEAHAADSILWKLDFGLETPLFPMDDEMHCEALILAAQKFRDEVWPQFESKTRGVVIYQGTADFAENFSWSEKQEMQFVSWKENHLLFRQPHLKRLYCADVYANYFQLLAHKLPDDLPITLFCNAENIGTFAERHHLLSKERFEHFELVTKGLPFTNGLIWEEESQIIEKKREPVGICFPENEFCTHEVLQKIDEKMGSMTTPFRVVSEPFLTEEWVELDVLYVFKDAMSPRGARKLQGFTVAGGETVYVGRAV